MKDKTATYYKALPIKSRKYEETDSRVEGLSLRVYPSGVKSWSLRFTIRGVGRARADLGRFPDLSVSQAREIALAWKQEGRLGRDPRPLSKSSDADYMLKQVILSWNNERVARSKKQTLRRMELHVFDTPAFAEMDVRKISTRDVSKHLQKLTQKKNLVAERNRVRGDLHAAFAFAIRTGRLEGANPVSPIEKVLEESKRRDLEEADRVLSVSELAKIWIAAEECLQPVPRAITQALLLLPLRKREMSGLSRAEIFRSDQSWNIEIPSRRMKGKRPYRTRVTNRLKEIFESVPWGQDLVFTSNGVSRYEGWSGALEKLRKCTNLDARWTFHDFRRGVSTAMGDLGVAESIIARILAHSPKSSLGVTSVYLKSEYLDERFDALTRWQEHLFEAINQELEKAPVK